MFSRFGGVGQQATLGVRKLSFLYQKLLDRRGISLGIHERLETLILVDADCDRPIICHIAPDSNNTKS